MDVKELLDFFKTQDITLRWDGKDIKWTAPFDYVPTGEILKLVHKNKDDIIKRIQGPLPEWLLNGTRITRLTQGGCLNVMREYPDNLVDLIVTDPPYGYNFMGKDWDKAVPSIEIWQECLRVLKPGGFAFIMSAPRQDVLARMIVNLEAAGFQTGFTSLYWTYAKGFPKAINISKAIDKKAGAETKVLGRNPNRRENCDKSSTIYESGSVGKTSYTPSSPSTPEATSLDGSYGGYQPKPAVEVVIIAQKPRSEETYAAQALSNKKGVTWLDDCRIPYLNETPPPAGDRTCNFGEQQTVSGGKYGSGWEVNKAGRFPANLIVSDETLGDKYSRFFSLDAWSIQKISDGLNIEALNQAEQQVLPFLIVPKVTTKEKEFGCEDIIPQQVDKSRNDPIAIGCNNPRNRGGKVKRNFHPTVKPILLMSYLITLGSREGDIVLDPFCGSGTTNLAAHLLKRASIGIEKDSEYFNIVAARIKALTLANWDAESHPNPGA